MPRKIDPIQVRKARSEQAIEIAKKSKTARTINAEQLGLALEVTSRFAVSLINEICNPNDKKSPVKVWGASGVPFEIHEIPMFKAIIADCDRRLAERDAQSRITDDYRAIRSPDTTGSKRTIQEIALLTRSHRELEKMAREQGDVVLAEHHRQVVSDLCLFAAEAFDSVATEIDADGSWPDDVRSLVTEWAMGKQIALHDKFSEYLTDNAAPGAN